MESSGKGEGEADELEGIMRIIVAIKRMGESNRKCMMKGEKEKEKENIS